MNKYKTTWLSAITIICFLSACSKATYPKQEKAFCSAIDDSYAQWRKKVDAPDYIDKQSDIQKIFDSREGLLTPILGNGSVESWSGTVKEIIPSNDGAYLKIGLPCRASLVPTDKQLIPKKSPLYEQARKLHEGDELTFSGKLFGRQPQQTSGASQRIRFGYEENSITDTGAMSEPEFVFTLTKIIE